MSIRIRKAKALQTPGATLWKGDSKWVRAVQSETPAGGLLSLQNEDVKRIPANGVRERPPSQGDLEEAALRPSPLSRPARGVKRQASRRPTHRAWRRPPHAPPSLTCDVQESQALGLQRRPRGQRFLAVLHGCRGQRLARRSSQLGASGSALCTRGAHGRGGSDLSWLDLSRRSTNHRGGVTGGRGWRTPRRKRV